MSNYYWIKTLGEGLEILTGFPHGTMMWAECTVRTAKVCVECRKKLKKKQAYRPITNRGNRGERICLNCMENMRNRHLKDGEKL